MLMMPVDLFGAYTKGREYAIDRNWNDLNQSANVESKWLANDQRQLKNWFGQDTYQNSIDNNNAATAMSQMGLATQQAAYPGSINAGLNYSDKVTMDRQALVDNAALIQNSISNSTRANAENVNYNAGQMSGQAGINQRLLPEGLNAYEQQQRGKFAADVIAGSNAGALTQGDINNTLAGQQLKALNIAEGIKQVPTNADLFQANADYQRAHLAAQYPTAHGQPLPTPPIAQGTPVGQQGIQQLLQQRTARVAALQQQLQQLQASGGQNTIPYFNAQAELRSLAGVN